MSRTTPVIALMLPAMALAGCVSAPQVVGTSPAAQVQGKSLALLASQAAPKDDASLQASALVLSKLGGEPTRNRPADYLLQVSFTTLPPKVGVSRAGAPVAPAWTAPPEVHHWWQWRRKRPGGYALTIVGLDTATGKPAFAVSATEHRRERPEAAVTRLVEAALAPPAPAR